jgi:predicted nuclease of predicted toxin-antitoxin system
LLIYQAPHHPCDIDFGDLMAASSGICPSVIIFRLENERPENVNRKLRFRGYYLKEN